MRNSGRRDLMPILEYTKWQNFKTVLLKAQIACENSGNDPADHFTDASKMVAIGSDAKREVEDIHLSRYACYLIVQNADPTKEVVALGQTYFAVQTRRQEISDAEALAELTEDQRRLLLRQRIKMQNSDLASAAKNAGVITSQDFAIFQNHGYRGLYNGLTAEGIHRRKAEEEPAYSRPGDGTCRDLFQHPSRRSCGGKGGQGPNYLL